MTRTLLFVSIQWLKGTQSPNLTVFCSNKWHIDDKGLKEHKTDECYLKLALSVIIKDTPLLCPDVEVSTWNMENKQGLVVSDQLRSCYNPLRNWETADSEMMCYTLRSDSYHWEMYVPYYQKSGKRFHHHHSVRIPVAGSNAVIIRFVCLNKIALLLCVLTLRNTHSVYWLSVSI